MAFETASPCFDDFCGSAIGAELDIEILTAGDGITAAAGKRVTVHYEGRLTDGTVFDASRNRGQPFAFTIGAGQVILAQNRVWPA